MTMYLSCRVQRNLMSINMLYQKLLLDVDPSCSCCCTCSIYRRWYCTYLSRPKTWLVRWPYLPSDLLVRFPCKWGGSFMSNGCCWVVFQNELLSWFSMSLIVDGESYYYAANWIILYILPQQLHLILFSLNCDLCCSVKLLVVSRMLLYFS